MLLLHKLVEAAQTKTILSNTGFNKRGITPLKDSKLFQLKNVSLNMSGQ